MRPKTILVVVLVAAAAAAVVIPTLRKHRAESAESERKDRDAEIGRYYDQTAKPVLKAAAAKEPARVVGKVLPVAVKNSLPPEPDALLDTTLYTELAPELRTDQLDGAGTIVFVDRDGTAIYAGGATGMATVATGLTITLFDPATKTVLGQKQFDGGNLPEETDKAGLDNVSARQAARIAAYLKSLPR